MMEDIRIEWWEALERRAAWQTPKQGETGGQG